MALYQVTNDFEWAGRTYRKGEMFEDDADVYSQFPSRFTLVPSGSGATGMTLEYIEWTFDGTLTKSVVFPAGTVLRFGCVVVLEDFTSIDPTFSLGTSGDLTAFVNGATPQTVDVLALPADMGGSPGPNGLNWGFPVAADNFTLFNTETTVVGTLDPTTSTAGMLRFYFTATIPTAATLA